MIDTPAPRGVVPAGLCLTASGLAYHRCHKAITLRRGEQKGHFLICLCLGQHPARLLASCLLLDAAPHLLRDALQVRRVEDLVNRRARYAYEAVCRLFLTPLERNIRSELFRYFSLIHIDSY